MRLAVRLRRDRWEPVSSRLRLRTFIAAFLVMSASTACDHSTREGPPASTAATEVQHGVPIDTSASIMITVLSVKSVGQAINHDSPPALGPTWFARTLVEVSGSSSESVFKVGSVLKRWTSHRSATLVRATVDGSEVLQLDEYDDPIDAKINRRYEGPDAVHRADDGRFVWIIETTIGFRSLPSGQVTINFNSDAVRDMVHLKSQFELAGASMRCPSTTLIMPVPTPNVPIQSGAGIAAP